MLIVAITGMPGAGKSTAAKALESRGFKRIVMGDVIREETRRRGLEPSEKDTAKVMLELREKYGPGAVAEVCVRLLGTMKEQAVVIDGIRSPAEVEVFARVGKVRLIAIHASRERRFKLLRERGRGDAPTSRGSFDERDKRELSIGVGDAVALADESLSNEHTTPEELGKKAVELVDSWVASAG
jgi:dephospho-CoA kinase